MRFEKLEQRLASLENGLQHEQTTALASNSMNKTKLIDLEQSPKNIDPAHKNLILNYLLTEIPKSDSPLKDDLVNYISQNWDELFNRLQNDYQHLREEAISELSVY